MGSYEGFRKAKNQLSNFLLPDKERIESLRHILEIEQCRTVTFEEADEIGTQLIGLYEGLAGNRPITGTGLSDTSKSKNGRSTL